MHTTISKPINSILLEVPRNFKAETYVKRALAKGKKSHLILGNQDGIEQIMISGTPKPGERYRAEVLRVLSQTHSEECVRHIKERQGVLLGLQGFLLVCLKQPRELLDCKFLVSFGETHQDGIVPYGRMYPNGHFELLKAKFKGHWYAWTHILAFFREA